MNLPDHLLPSAWYWTGLLLFLPPLSVLLRRAPWRRLGEPKALNVWLGACVAVMLLWDIKTGLKPGLNFHLLGMTALTLMFGPHLALCAGLVVLLAVTLFGGAGGLAFAINAIIMVGLPVWLSHSLYRLVDARLPNHPFVYIFANAFLGGALAMACVGFATALTLLLSGVYAWDYLRSNYLPYYILMA